MVAVFALLPLWSAALSLKDIVIRKNAADLRFLPISCSARDITIAAANLGDKPGAF